MQKNEAFLKLQHLGEEHLFNQWDRLDPQQQQNLLRSVESLDSKTFKLQQKTLQDYQSGHHSHFSFQAIENVFSQGSIEDDLLGKKLLTEGKVGCLLVAGGQGTRLSYSAPKGTFPVSLIQNKSLFQLFAEKTLACGKQAGRLLSLAIMTSPTNHAETVAFFQKHRYFGLQESQVSFFSQKELPFLDAAGHLILESNGTIAQGPDGNGGALSCFVQSGIWDAWHRHGIEFVNYVLVDNALADPFDAGLIGFHARHHSEITVKCIEKVDAEERVGLLVSTDEGMRVIEYSEMAEADRNALDNDGKLKYRCANLSLFCFDMQFILDVSDVNLPLHFAYKAVSVNGTPTWKSETFIFDILPQAKRIKALLYPRNICFAPLKNKIGGDSLDTVQQRLLERDLFLLAAVTGHPVEPHPIELDMQFHYPTKELLTYWQGREGPFHGYIEPKTGKS